MITVFNTDHQISPFQMSLFLSIFFALVSVLSSVSSSSGNLSESPCPLNFDAIRRLVNEGPKRPMLTDMNTQCQIVLQGIRLLRAEYLRTNGYFLPPVNSSCYESCRNFVTEFVQGFDIRTSCGYYPELISEACMNITSRAQFESLIPKSKLQEIKRHCSQSLENSFACDSCTSKLSSLSEILRHGPGNGNGNVSDCSGYPYLYAAAVVNQFGPIDRATARCLFSLYFSARQSSLNKRHEIVIYGLVLGSVIGILGAFTAFWFLFTRSKKSEERVVKVTENDEPSLVLESRSSNLARFKIEEIKAATMNFSRENIIGKGGYGNVYKGMLPNGTEVAVKRFKNCSKAGDANFKHEVEIIASVKHVNLVALRGYSTATVPLEGHQRIIVCDLLHNGSLYDYLFRSGMKKLSWPIRLRIALGTARGLAYLHYGVQPAIIHRDIKASNILLDEAFEAKVGDFGLAKFNPEGITHLSTRVAGTLGYVAPEYALYGKLTPGSDVYSFGVVLLELLSGKKACEIIQGKSVLLSDWAWELVKEGKALDVIEENMPEMELPEMMEQYVLTAAICAHPILQARPTMDQIVKILETDVPVRSILASYVASFNREEISVSSSYMSSSAESS